MKRKLFFILIALLLLAGCQQKMDQSVELAESQVESESDTAIEEPGEEIVTELEEVEETVVVENVESYYENQLLPLDQTSEDTSLEAFIVKLKEVIQNRDIETFKQMTDSGIKLSFGGDGGVDQLESFWVLDTEEGQERFWGELDTIINMGGVFSSDELIFYPYVFGAFPSEFDSFMHLAVIDENVELYEAPDLQSTLQRYLNYNIVEYVDVVGDYEAPEFYKIKLSNGTEGFVKGEFCRSPIDYRLGIMKEEGEWRMVFLVAGD